MRFSPMITLKERPRRKDIAEAIGKFLEEGFMGDCNLQDELK